MDGARYSIEHVLYPYERVDGQDRVDHHPVVIVGGGPIGLSLALDLGRRGTSVLLVDDHEGAGMGSKAICFAKRTLEILDRLGAGEVADKGVRWNLGRVFHGDDEVFTFDLLAEPGHKMPAFVNIQQPEVERALVEAIRREISDGAPIELRGRNCVINVDDRRVDIETPDGRYSLTADWIIACDGARSPLRDMLDLGFEGRVFEDNFLIADVRMKAPFPAERWFWFEPPFKGSGASALLHQQPDDIWRIDFQLGWDIDRDVEMDEAKIRARVDEMLEHGMGKVPDYELVWTSIYTFQCRRMESFRCGNVIFAGDSAHQVSPFGARGANSGIQDADNLGWKLDLVLKGQASEALLDSYCEEREMAADENILNSTRATDFMTPKSPVAQRYRDAVLSLARTHAFARTLINSGRLSTPSTYDGSKLNSADGLVVGPDVSRPGAPCPDAIVEDGSLLNAMDAVSGGFILLTIGKVGSVSLDGVETMEIAEPSESLRERYLGDVSEAVYLIRPDRHITARWDKNADFAELQAALNAAVGEAA